MSPLQHSSHAHEKRAHLRLQHSGRALLGSRALLQLGRGRRWPWGRRARNYGHYGGHAQLTQDGQRQLALAVQADGLVLTRQHQHDDLRRQRQRDIEGVTAVVVAGQGGKATPYDKAFALAISAYEAKGKGKSKVNLPHCKSFPDDAEIRTALLCRLQHYLTRL